MITIVCKSELLASELTAISGATKTIVFPYHDSTGDESYPVQWLSDCLKKNLVSIVLYEPHFFIDPSQFRSISPKTHFIVLSSPGDEHTTQTALVCGACAVIDKPLTEQDVRGVLSLVSQ